MQAVHAIMVTKKIPINCNFVIMISFDLMIIMYISSKPDNEIDPTACDKPPLKYWYKKAEFEIIANESIVGKTNFLLNNLPIEKNINVKTVSDISITIELSQKIIFGPKNRLIWLNGTVSPQRPPKIR